MLLHALATIKNDIDPELIAVHINHGMSPEAELWENHCKEVTRNYAIKFQNYSVDLSQKSDKGIEAFAREKRYEVLGNLIRNNDLLLTAHHMDDQVETILLQLMRGCGPNGLVGMPQSRRFSKGLLLRPFLDYSKEEIHGYALNESLNWVEDESNKSNKYDRNFLRNKIIPELLMRWPGALKTVRRAAGHQAEARSLINEISKSDLENICENGYRRIEIAEFDKLSDIRKKNTLRAWIKKNNMQSPSAQIIEKINTELVHANNDRNPCVKWKGCEVRRYREYIYIMRSLPAHDTSTSTIWDLKDPLILTSGCLKAVACKGRGIKKDMLSKNIVEIRYRQGGEQLKPFGRREMHDLKKMFQEEGVLPWNRDRIPLIFYNNELIAVGDLWIEHKYATMQSEIAWQFEWNWIDDYQNSVT